MSAQHTPGPWVVDASAEVVYGTSHEGEHIVVVYELNTNEADGRLIAAAPDLLAALRDLDACYCEVHEEMSRAERAYHRGVLMAARAAIAKATEIPSPGATPTNHKDHDEH